MNLQGNKKSGGRHNMKLGSLSSPKIECNCLICKIKKIQESCYCAVQKSLRNGKIKRKPCEICGERKSFAHHEDYSKPLEVLWLCSKHHRQKHRYRFFSHFHKHFNPHDLTTLDFWNIQFYKEEIWFYDDLIKILQEEKIRIPSFSS